MTAPRQIQKSNVVIGAGAFFVDLIDDSGAYTGERYLGDTTAGTLTVATETTEVFSGDGPIAERLVSIVRQINRTMGVTVQDMSPENLALFIAGTASRADKAVGATADERLTVNKGRWYTLGQSATKPNGAGSVPASGTGTPVVKNVAANSPGSTTYTEGTGADDDYRLDAAAGRIYILPGGDIADGAELSVAYTPSALGTGEQVGTVKTGAARQLRGAVRYVEEASAGAGRHFYARRCLIGATGDLALKSRDTPQTIGLTIAIEEPPDAYPALAIDGVAR